MDLLDEALKRFAEEYRSVAAAGPKEPTAVTLATASATGRPSIRTVLLKAFDRNGFTFYTNLESRKGRDIAENPRAALCFYWSPIDRQVVVEGGVEKVPEAEADAYWASRPRDSQIGAWASLQSRPMPSRVEFASRIARYAVQYAVGPVPRPSQWTGLRVIPDRIEFWKSMPFRLHERTLYERSGDQWTKTLLYP